MWFLHVIFDLWTWDDDEGDDPFPCNCWLCNIVRWRD